MEDRKRLVIHVGYPKSGTTSMQRNLYPQIGDRAYLGKPKKFGVYNDEQTGRSWNIWGNIRRIVGADDAHFYNALPEIAASLRRRVLDSDQDVVVLSDEDLLRPSRCLSQTRSLSDVSRIPERLRVLHEEGLSDICDLHVLITIRRQSDLIPSYYAQFGGEEVYYGVYRAGFDRFLRFCLEDDQIGYGPVFDFDAMVARFESAIGESYVHVVAMEALFDPGDAVAAKTMAQLIGVSQENVKDTLAGRVVRSKRRPSDEGTVVYSAYHVPVGGRAVFWRVMDRLLPKQLRYSNTRTARLLIRFRKLAKRTRPREYFKVEPDARARLEQAYVASNHRLEARRKLGLNRYGYC
ncbi:hypothetical protein V6X62_02725 [Spiribacter sp. 218]|uniref:hypothetical protein n=1 Tax=Spiribacter pallidus TaxID=1987936 RepID=UPI00349F384F